MTTDTTIHEIRRKCYRGQGVGFLYDGFTIQQWDDIAARRAAAGDRAGANEARQVVLALEKWGWDD